MLILNLITFHVFIPGCLHKLVFHTGHGSQRSKQEMVQAGLDSSILAPFLPEPDIPRPSELPPTGPIHLDPMSYEYFEKICTALE